mgnify:CR=1 FL=1
MRTDAGFRSSETTTPTHCLQVRFLPQLVVATNRIIRTSLVCLLVFFSAGVVMTGCSNQPSKPKTYPVTGTVTLNGKPVEGATVTFVPKDPNAGDPKPRAATAITDANGRYAIGTFATGDGAIPGEYLVKVTKYRVPNQQQQAAREDAESEMQAYLQYQQAPQQVKTGPQNELPAKYENEKTSGLFITVQPGQNTFNIDLKP